MVTVDRDRCTGHGRCYALAPGIYRPDDAGRCVIDDAVVPTAAEAQARLGARNCPEAAITLVDLALPGTG
jgi:ferredoxin